ncbi:MAG: hypothetical protein JWM44_2068 [Bacilli bacterium]|nr:hypothetical protein [Bacilli bacterium]
MSLYNERLDAIMEAHECNMGEAVELMTIDFAHDVIEPQDDWDLFQEEED